MTADLRAQLQTTLGTAYRLDQELGGGGMSRVFVADEVALGRKVVVKVISPDLAEGVSAERFTREVQLAARLQQANIVPVLSAGTAAGIPYYTMPFVDGLSLRARLQRGAIPSGEARGILRDVARALAYAHGQGIVHRDIKPENILLSGGAAVVTDFGIAKALSAARTEDGADEAWTNTGLTRAGTSLGTPAYMAPEQAVGDPSTDYRADLYSWGVVAWELLAGRHPFANQTTQHGMIGAHLRERPPELGVARPDVAPELAALVMRCLEKNPALRPGSASEMLESIDVERMPTRVDTPVNRRRWIPAIAAVAVVALGAVFIAWRAGRSPPANDADKSLAVLPFESVGGDTANTYFAEGIADELTTALSRLPGLRLAGRSSVASYKQRGAPPQEIGAALKVAAVLDGTVRRAGDRIRVSAELTSTADGRVLWKQSYERELKDVFAVQDDITRAIVGALQVELTGSASHPNAAGPGTTNLEAYDLYLRALQLYRTRSNLLQSERYLAQAIALDSGFAPAWAMLASVLTVQPYYVDVSIAEVLSRARVVADRAVALDNELADAHLARGHVLAELFEWSQSDAEFRKAIALDPNRAETAFRYGFMLITCGRVAEAIVQFERAKAIDPFYPVSAAYLGWALALNQRADEAISEAQRAFDLDSNESVRSVRALTMRELGRREETLALAQQSMRLTNNTRRIGAYAGFLAENGLRDEALAVLRRLERLPATSQGRNSGLVTLYLGLGDTTRALEALEAAAAGDGDMVLAWVITSRGWDPIRRSPRFVAAMRRFNLEGPVVTSPGGGRSR